MATDPLNALAVGYAFAIVSAAGMLLLGILGNFGVYAGAVAMMEQWHVFFSLSVLGILAGMIEAAVLSFVGGYAFAAAYNRFT